MGKSKYLGSILMALLAGALSIAPVLAEDQPKWPFMKERAEKASAPAGAGFKDLEALAQEVPDFGVQMYRLAGQTLINRNQPARAVGMYAQASKLLPGDSVVMEDLAAAQVAAGQKKEAMATWNVILAPRKDDIGAQIRYANFLDKAGETDDAIVVMREVAAKQPDNTAPRYWVTDAYVRLGKPSEAAKELQAMEKAFPGEASEIKRRLGLLQPVKEAPAPKPAPATKAKESF